MKKIILSAMLPTAMLILTACHDDLSEQARYNDGFLHFTLNDNGQWNDGVQTRMAPAIVMEKPDFVSDTLYLHCEISNQIATRPDTAKTTVTRGRRLTGEVFEEGGGIESFGVYATVGNEIVLPFTTKIERDPLAGPEDGWYIKNEQAINFENEGDYWSSDKTGSFYAFAPFNGNLTDEAKCINVGIIDGVPSITFTMQPDEADNKDILTAKAENVSSTAKSTGIELDFQHILSALKFRFSDHIISAQVDNHDYYMQIKSVKLKGIYSQGTAKIGADVPRAAGEETEAMRYWNIDSSTGDCSIAIYNMRTRDEMVEDGLLYTDEHCMMVLPQQAPSGATLEVCCDLSSDEAGVNIIQQDVTFSAPLGGLKWRPGYSYTYTLNKNSLVTQPALTSKVNGVNGGDITFTSAGGLGEKVNLKVKSAKNIYDSNGNAMTPQPVPWHIEYSEFVYSSDDPADVTSGEWSEWVSGILPYGYYLMDSSNRPIHDLTEISGSTSDKDYYLVATQNVAYPTSADSQKSVFKLRSDDNYYEPNSSDGYYDLSYQSDATLRNTANCYMIKGYGKFKLPLVYGNGIRDGKENHAAFSERSLYPTFINYKAEHITSPYIITDTGVTPASASIVWEDEFGLITDYSLDTQTDHGYLKFELQKYNIRPGNAIIAIKDANDDIMWSWHIWVTNLEYTAKDGAGQPGYIHYSGQNNYINVTDYNLGHREKETVETVKPLKLKIRVVQNEADAFVEHNSDQSEGIVTFGSSNLYYQYGRKDPMPAQVNGEDYVERIRSYGYDWQVDNNKRTGADMSDAIKNPNRLYIHENTFPTANGSSTSYSTLNSNWCCVPGTHVTPSGGCREWNPERNSSLDNKSFSLYKTIYDPCPVGYTIPPLAFGYVFNSTTFTKEGSGDIPTLDATISGQNFSFPLAGERTITGNTINFPTQASFWTGGVTVNTNQATQTQFDRPWQLESKITTVTTESGSTSSGSFSAKVGTETTHALSIRPVVERRPFETKPGIPSSTTFTVNLHNSGSNQAYIQANQKGYGSTNQNYATWAGISAMVFDYYDINPEDYNFTINLYPGCAVNNNYLSANSFTLNVTMNGNSVQFTYNHPKLVKDPNISNVQQKQLSDFGFTNNTQFINWIRSHPTAILSVSATGQYADEVRLARASITVTKK